MLLEKIELEPGEEVLVIVRKHWFVIVAELFGIFVMLLLPFLLVFGSAVLESMFSAFNFNLSDYSALLVFGICAWIMLSLLSGFAIWTHYYLDLWVVTDRRIILVDQIRFFSRNVSVFRLERTQDIEYQIKGIIPTLLNFGTITAQTAGHFESNFRSTGMPDPRGLQATIQKAMDNRLNVLHIAPDQILNG